MHRQSIFYLCMILIALGAYQANTSFVSRKKNFKIEKDKSFMNTVDLISNEIVASKGVCTVKCTMEQNCCAASFDTTNGMCRLTQNCGPEVESSASSIVIKRSTTAEILLDANCTNNGPTDQCSDPMSTCTFFNNDYLCKCNTGYYNNGGTCDGKILLDDNCTNNGPSDECSDPMSTCTFFNNDYLCKCNTGYYNNGGTCDGKIQVDAVCTNNGPTDQCSDPMSTCTFFNNDYLCKCNTGYYNNGGTCDGKNLLDAVCTNNGPSDQCKDPMSTCIAFNNSYFCKCNSGYYNNGGTCDRSECRRSAVGYLYLGRVNMTVNNRQCQRWDVDNPHITGIDRNLYSAGNLDENYCRNPDMWNLGPWCYTVDPNNRYEHCNIPFCEGPPKECLESAKGVEYFGHISKSDTGRVCKRWDEKVYDAQQPNEVYYLHDQENYCRNPYGLRDKPWCYVGNGWKWEYCSIPIC